MSEVVVSKNFIEQEIDKDLREGVYDTVVTRFPPEPNGYLHIGHAKSILLNYGLAQKYNGKFHMRFDDTNPTKEKIEFVESIKADIQWLGADWKENLFFASDYFGIMYECAVKLIKKGKAYVCDLTPDEIREYRGTLTEPGKNSPYRERSIEENLDLFERMKNGEFKDGERVLRAKIDMASPNINMRDPIIYRVAHMHHHNTGDKWCIYPMYDFAHPIEDAVEKITHSICTLEFEDHRPLYDWVGINLGFEPKPRQIEFARLAVTNMVMSKRYLKRLVEEGHVHGWDDPRMPTVTGLRNRGVPPEALLDFCTKIGIVKANSECQLSYLEACIRENLNENAERAMAVLEPLKVTITNYEGSEQLSTALHPLKPELGERPLAFSGTVYIDKADFSLDPPPKYQRLKLGGYVRLKNAYIIRCDEVVQDDKGEVVELKCTYVPESRSSCDTSGIKVKGTIQWVDAATGVPAEIRKYSYLLKDAEYAGQDFGERMNLDSETIYHGYAEPYLAESANESRFQLMRVGYYKKCVDEKGGLVLSEIVSLKDNFNK